jgi:hypothetical protein
MLGNDSFTLNITHSILPSIPQTPYNLFPFIVPTLILPIKFSSTKAKFLQEESLLNKRRISSKKKERKKGQGTKGKEVKPDLPIQGHGNLHEKKRMGTSSRVGETF